MNLQLKNNLNNFKQVTPDLEEKLEGKYYNCWGFTNFILGWVEELHWEDEGVTVKLLDRKTKRIKKADIKVGDIVRFTSGRKRRDYWLQHTALVTEIKRNKIKVLHKPGGMPLEMTTFEKAKGMYQGSDGKITFLRPSYA
jgi:hypothetical protein